MRGDGSAVANDPSDMRLAVCVSCCPITDAGYQVMLTNTIEKRRTGNQLDVIFPQIHLFDKSTNILKQGL